jgi:hypothetical protein
VLREEPRGSRLGICMVRLLRAMVFRDWYPDWVFGLAQESMARNNVPVEHYGYRRTIPCFDEQVDFGPRHDREWLSTISRLELHAEYAGDPLIPAPGEVPRLDQGNGDHSAAAGK